MRHFGGLRDLSLMRGESASARRTYAASGFTRTDSSPITAPCSQMGVTYASTQ